MHTKIFNFIKVSLLALSLSFGLSFVYAWTAPTVTPPGGNVAAPINISSVAQTKAGALTVGGLITAGDITGANRAAMNAVTTGVYDDVTSNSPYSRINADSFHTNGLGVGQLFLEGNAIDANSPINIGKGLAGGQTTQSVNVGTLNATVVSAGTLTVTTGAAAGKVLTSDAAGAATWQTAAGGGAAPIGGGGDLPEESFYTTAGTYSFVVPPWMNKVHVEAVGGGGGGGAGINSPIGGTGSASSFGTASAPGGGGGAVGGAPGTTGAPGASGARSGGVLNPISFSPYGYGGAGGLYSTWPTTNNRRGGTGGVGGYFSGVVSVTPGQTKSIIVGAGGIGGCYLGYLYCGIAGQPGFVHLTFMPAPTLGNNQIFTSNGTFTVPAGVTFIAVDVWGAGGAGGTGGASQNYTGYWTYTAGGGGASGGYAKSFFTVTPGRTYSVVVGAGGTGSQAGFFVNGGQSGRVNTQGKPGGTSSFGSGATLVSAPGGAGGVSFDTYCGGGGCNGNISCTAGWTSSGGVATNGNFLNAGGSSGAMCNVGTGAPAVVHGGRSYGAGGAGGPNGATTTNSPGGNGGVVVSW